MVTMFSITQPVLLQLHNLVTVQYILPPSKGKDGLVISVSAWCLGHQASIICLHDQLST